MRGLADVDQHCLGALRGDGRAAEALDHTNGLQQVGRGCAGADQTVDLGNHGIDLQIDLWKSAAELLFEPPCRRGDASVEQAGARQEKGARAVGRDDRARAPLRTDPFAGTFLPGDDPVERLMTGVIQARNVDHVELFAHIDARDANRQTVTGANRLAGHAHEPPLEKICGCALLLPKMRIGHLQQVGESAEAGDITPIQRKYRGFVHGMS